MKVYDLLNNTHHECTPGSKPLATSVRNLIIVDESGSMSSIYQAALNGLNQTLDNIRDLRRESPDVRQTVSLHSFSSLRFNTIYKDTPAENTSRIKPKDYRPSGGTPLYDAMGRGITELRPNVLPGEVVLVTIITDGLENASTEFNRFTINKMIEELKTQGWVFTYIGANQDVEEVAGSLGIQHHMAFAADEAGTEKMFATECKARHNFISRLRNAESIEKFTSEDYF